MLWWLRYKRNYEWVEVEQLKTQLRPHNVQGWKVDFEVAEAQRKCDKEPYFNVLCEQDSVWVQAIEPASTEYGLSRDGDLQDDEDGPDEYDHDEYGQEPACKHNEEQDEPILVEVLVEDDPNPYARGSKQELDLDDWGDWKGSSSSSSSKMEPESKLRNCSNATPKSHPESKRRPKGEDLPEARPWKKIKKTEGDAGGASAAAKKQEDQELQYMDMCIKLQMENDTLKAEAHGHEVLESQMDSICEEVLESQVRDKQDEAAKLQQENARLQDERDELRLGAWLHDEAAKQLVQQMQELQHQLADAKAAGHVHGHVHGHEVHEHGHDAGAAAAADRSKPPPAPPPPDRTRTQPPPPPPARYRGQILEELGWAKPPPLWS